MHRGENSTRALKSDFMAVLQEVEDAKKEYQRLGEEKDRLAGDIRGCEKDQEQGQKEQKKRYEYRSTAGERR